MSWRSTILECFKPFRSDAASTEEYRQRQSVTVLLSPKRENRTAWSLAASAASLEWLSAQRGLGKDSSTKRKYRGWIYSWKFSHSLVNTFRMYEAMLINSEIMCWRDAEIPITNSLTGWTGCDLNILRHACQFTFWVITRRQFPGWSGKLWEVKFFILKGATAPELARKNALEKCARKNISDPFQDL